MYEFVAKPVSFRRVGGLLKLICYFQESCSSVLVGGDAIAQEIGESPFQTHMPGDGNRVDLRDQIDRNGNIDSRNFR